LSVIETRANDLGCVTIQETNDLMKDLHSARLSRAEQNLIADRCPNLAPKVASGKRSAPLEGRRCNTPTLKANRPVHDTDSVPRSDDWAARPSVDR
jgi:hypothetical protein